MATINKIRCNGTDYDIGSSVSETEWIDLEFNTGWENLSTDYNSLQYKQISNQIFIRGMITNNSSTNLIAMLPEDIRPSKINYINTIMSDVYVPLIVRPNGQLYMSKYTGGKWVSINDSYFID